MHFSLQQRKMVRLDRIASVIAGVVRSNVYDTFGGYCITNALCIDYERAPGFLSFLTSCIHAYVPSNSHTFM